jgi:LPS-assembly protein
MVAVKIKRGVHYTLTMVSLAAIHNITYAASSTPEPIEACVIERNVALTPVLRSYVAHCLGWEDEQQSLCKGSYRASNITPVANEEVQIQADEASLYPEGRSELQGNVEIRESQRIVNAKTAYIYRDPKTKEVTKIELVGDVQYQEPDRLMIARKALINPQEKSGWVEDVLYRFSNSRSNAILPAWGRAGLVERFANQDYRLQKATYSTCAPQNNAWQIEASEITLDKAKSKGVAKNAVLRIHDWPLLYTPYLSFPTTNERKSGFLMPLYGYSNVGGFDFGLPYYWNIAPNYDATITPHLYTRRGLMMGGDFRFLTSNSTGLASAHFLPDDRAFGNYLEENRDQYPTLRHLSEDRWSVLLHENTQFTSNLRMGINYQQVSDDYYLQDFSTNLAILTQNQLLRQGELTYTTEHWLLNGMMQSYQTLHPINQSTVSDIYERFPQLLARGAYGDLPMHANFHVLAQFDNFHWPANTYLQPEGPRYHLNPILSIPQLAPWGYFTPSVQFVENYYDVQYHGGADARTFSRFIPRYSADSGLYFERSTSWMGSGFTQTLEPRLYYLNVPYHNQTPVPVYDSAYMIFNVDQLFRTNRFSGFDRIGDANQLAYALTTRLLTDETGREKASFTLGQIHYFNDRKVQLCYAADGSCTDNSLFLGYLSPLADTSPIASRLTYQLSSSWLISGDYVWDPYTDATNNGNLNFHYQPAANKIINLGYTYLVNGDVTQVANSAIQNSALHQATVSYAWPLNDNWSGLGVYSYNISKRYDMNTFLGVQYDSCCWAFRVLGGRTFKSLSPTTLSPQYNNNVYLQFLLKGLGSVASTDPASTIRTYLPGYQDIFHPQ